MDTNLLDQLKQRYEYESWPAASLTGENLFIWQFFLSDSQLPSLQAHRIQRVEVSNWPLAYQSIWRSREGQSQVLLRLDIFECLSRAAARPVLLRLLGEFQSPRLVREPEPVAGEVAFTVPDGLSILFVRTNLVVLMQSAGREEVSVQTIAQGFDRDLAARPDLQKGRVVPEIRRFAMSEQDVPIQGVVRLEVEAADPLDRPLWYKFYSSNGEVFLADGKLVYRAATTGTQTVTIYAIYENGGAATETLRFDVG